MARIVLGLASLSVVWSAALTATAEPETLVTRNLADSATATWAASAWNSASGSVGWSADRPEPAQAGSSKALEIAVRYSGKGFEFFSADLAHAQIPGRCRRVSVWVKATKPEYSWALKFKDADGQEQNGGKKLEFDLRATVDRWTKLEFTIPEQWKPPVSLVGVAAHNWEHKQQAAEVSLRIADLNVQTDISAVVDRRSLLKVNLLTSQERNLFLLGEPVGFRLVCDNWLGQRLTGSLSYRVTDDAGLEIAAEKRPLAFEGPRAELIELKPAKFGCYRLTAELALADNDPFRQDSRFAVLPRPHTYTPAEKMTSPYGLNIHGGQPGVAYRAIARTGFVWIRDYAYNRSWMVRAKGEDGRYGGWPWYPKMDQQIQQAGLLLLPVMGESLAPDIGAGKLQPDPQWKRDLLHILLSFPQYPAWELDNEYDYRHGREEAQRKWSSYQAYHKLFAQAVKFLDERTLAVEQGTAGLHPDLVQQHVQSGAFAQIDVVNGHFYCGTQPPEVSTENVNVGQAEAPPALVFDTLRELVAAAGCDGRHRQTWVTEFGWDTLAGQIVSEHLQAAYLQRGYALGLQAGLDKMFWYWERDTKEQPKQFFDGCGLFDPQDNPKPAAVAMAALVHFLKQPQALGTFDLGPDVLGHVFRDRGRLVACVYRIDPQPGSAASAGTATPKPALVELPRGELFDMFGNPLPERRVPLGAAPVWIVGLPEDDPAALQTAYDLKSRYLIRAVAGDTCTIEVRVRNHRQTALHAQLTAHAPQGWTITPAAAEISVAAGQTQVIPLAARIDGREPAGTKAVEVQISEGAVVKRLATQVMLVPAAEVAAAPLSGPAGTTALTVRLTNNSQQVRSFRVRTELPTGWKADPPQLPLADVRGGETRQAKLNLTWTNRWQPADTARVVAENAAGEVIGQAGIIPGAIRIPAVRSIQCDGDLSDWPASARLPRWALGLRGADPEAELYLGHSPEGIYLAVKTGRSRTTVTDPRSFWSQDCLELFLDTAHNKQARQAYQATDHQFWFCPLPAERRVYVGRWKRNAEIPETVFDVPGIKSGCVRTAGGYVFEVLLPAAILREYKPDSGRVWGLNLNLTTPGEHGPSEVFWPLSKGDEAPTSPHRWGLVELE